MHRIYLAVLFVLVAADPSAADELKQLWEFELTSPDRTEQVCACGFSGESTVVLSRSHDRSNKNVVFTTRTISDDGTSTENTLAEWPAKKRDGGLDRLLGYGVFPSVADPTMGKPGLIVAGGLVPGGIPVLQRFSDTGILEWTEPLPVGARFSCQHITAFDNGFLLAGGGLLAKCVSVDSVGQKLWEVSDKQKYRQVKKVAVHRSKRKNNRPPRQVNSVTENETVFVLLQPSEVIPKDSTTEHTETTEFVSLLLGRAPSQIYFSL